MKEIPNKLVRSDLRLAEMRARRILSIQNKGISAKLARDVLYIATHIDNIWAELFPVFEMIDDRLKNEHCTLESGRCGYKLLDSKGKVLAEAPTLREFLTKYVVKYGDQVTFPYDPDDD